MGVAIGRPGGVRPGTRLPDQTLLDLVEREQLPRLLKQLDRCHALVLDDIGYVQQEREEMEVLFNLSGHRCERG